MSQVVVSTPAAPRRSTGADSRAKAGSEVVTPGLAAQPGWAAYDLAV